MNGLKKYIVKKPKIVVDEVVIPDVEPIDYTEETDHARSLYMLFAALQSRHGKWVIPYRKDKRMRTCFKKLAQKIEMLADSGLDIDEIEYIMAHKHVYGVDLRPGHLISWCSIAIYNNYLEEKKAEVLELSDAESEALDDDMVTYLAELRGESKESVAELLTSCDLL